MKLIDQKQIRQIINKATTHELIANIETAFTSYSDGSSNVPAPGMLSFENPPGDVHIKFGAINGDEIYVVKIASGFYENSQLGLSNSNGMNLVFSQKTGQLQTILFDDGLLTDVRTAIAGMVAVKHLKPNEITKIGIVGNGIIAGLFMDFIHDVVTCNDVLVLGRSEEKLNQFKTLKAHLDLNIETTTDASRITKECNVILTATPVKEPVISGPTLPNTLIVAMGADTVGKQELHESLHHNADLIVMDSRTQCEHHGEIHKSIEFGALNPENMIELGTLISDRYQRDEEQLIIADLTGVATQDIQISKFVLNKL